MGLLAIELNDAGLRAVRAGAAGLLQVDQGDHSSPGVARVQGRTVVTGLAAARQASAYPFEVDSRFWDRLDTEPVQPKNPRSPNRAEVACADLQQVLHAVRQPGEDVVVAVPPVYDPKQLGILAGIARELSLPLKGVVASPVAVEPGSVPAGPVLVVDLALHRCVLSVVETGQHVVLARTRICPDVGLDGFRRQWLKAMGEEFVRSTRFDPRHDAATEQRLWDHVPEVLDTLTGGGSCTVTMETGSLVHGVTVTEAMLAHAGHGLVARLCAEIQEVVTAGGLAEILLAFDAARVPGLQRMLRQQIAVPVRGLEAGAAAPGLAASWPDRFDQSAAPAVAYHTQRVGSPDAPARRVEPSPSPTHLLLGEQAHPLQREPLFVDLEPRTGTLTLGGQSGLACLRRNGDGVVLEVKRGRVQVNGADVEGSLPVGLGARITVGGCSETITLIALGAVNGMIRRRKITLFSMSFLDCICCGFGAVILLFVIVNARTAATRNQKIMDLRGEVSKLDFEVLKGQKNLVQVRNALDETVEELVRTEGRSRRLIEQIKVIEEELASSENTTIATTEHVNNLKADLKTLEEEVKRMQAAVEADEEGAKLREFKGTGDRHYLTGLKVGGRRILILVDCSASMLGEKVVDIIRIRNMTDAEKLRSDKWRQAVRTVDWLSTQLPPNSMFQIYGFNSRAFALVEGTEGRWLDAGDPDDLERAVQATRARGPEGPTSLHRAFSVIERLPAPPDNILLLTDGLPTMSEKKPPRYKVSGKNRLKLFRSATAGLSRDIPINVILYPMEGDPKAASAFWRLAIDTGGSYLCPAKDWP